MEKFDPAFLSNESLISFLDELDYNKAEIDNFKDVMLSWVKQWMVENHFGCINHSEDECPIHEAHQNYAPHLADEEFAMCHIAFGIESLQKALDDNDAAGAAMAALTIAGYAGYFSHMLVEVNEQANDYPVNPTESHSTNCGA